MAKIVVDYSVLTEKIESRHKVPKLTVVEEAKITRYKNILQGYTENWSREIFIIDSVL